MNSLSALHENLIRLTQTGLTFPFLNWICFQPSRFQLNHASAKNSGEAYSDREYSIWVADLPSDISEDEFRKTFATRYASIKTTKGRQLSCFNKENNQSDTQKISYKVFSFYEIAIQYCQVIN